MTIDWRRFGQLIGLSALIAVIAVSAITLPGIWQEMAEPDRWKLVQSLMLLAILAAGWMTWARPAEPLGIRLPTRFWERLDHRAGRLIGRPLTGILLGLVVVMMLTWIPHYLRWPWWTDTDHFAVTALSWERGILPYQDLIDFNFPGPIYVFWALGKIFGWGRTLPFNAFDAALLALLGVALIGWSRQKFASVLPGACGYLAFLTYYLGLDFSGVGQRDWHAALFATVGLLALEVDRGRLGRVVSAIAFASALCYRPHAVLFLPAYASAIDENARAVDEPRSRTVRGIVEWGLVAALATLCAFAPLLWTHVIDDLLVTLLQSGQYGSAASERVRRSASSYLLEDFLQIPTLLSLGVLGVLAFRARVPWGRTARTWLIAIGSILLYKPMSPVVFPYHDHPLRLLSAVALGVVVAGLISARRLAPAFQFAAIAGLLVIFSDGMPNHCSVVRTAMAVQGIARGTPPALAPLGCAETLPNRLKSEETPCWEDYSAVLDYLRKATGPRTRVANLLRRHPCPPINGPVGRLTTFPCAEGTQWLRWVNPELEWRFAAAMVEQPDTVVVWNPRFVGFPTLEKTVRAHFEPEARFGPLEVWRRTVNPVRPIPELVPVEDSQVNPAADPGCPAVTETRSFDPGGSAADGLPGIIREPLL